MVPDWKAIFRGTPQSETNFATVELDSDRLPKHIAIIMDGNGRWARAKGLPRAAGHHAGMVAMRETIRAADDFGIQALTLYAFSTENWKRPRTEIQYLWYLLDEFFQADIDELVERNVRISFLGDTSKLPSYSQKTIESALRKTANNDGLIVQFALNYGSRAEIVDVIRMIAQDVKDGKVDLTEIEETLISSCLCKNGVPDPDLLIRTSGDQRVSNFLLWQIAYAELYFVDEMWPDFSRELFYEAITAYTKRERRFGGLK